MLRCGLCEEAMLPRSASHSRDVYVCRTRKQTGGAGACPMPPLPRVSVVYAALRLFPADVFDVGGETEQEKQPTAALDARARAPISGSRRRGAALTPRGLRH